MHFRVDECFPVEDLHFSSFVAKNFNIHFEKICGFGVLNIFLLHFSYDEGQKLSLKLHF